MAQDHGNPANYYASIAGAGSFWALRINDVTVWRDFEAADTNLSVPVNAFLTQGRNDVDVTFVSVMGSPIAYNVANPDFYFIADLLRVDLVTRDRLRATMLNLALDGTDNSVLFPDMTRTGLPVDIRSLPPMKTGRDVADQADLVSGWGDHWTGRRITAQVQIDDPLPAPPWATAPVLADTPDMRATLLDAYRRLHAVLGSGDRGQVRASYQTAWQHLAIAMNYASVDEFIDKTHPFQDLAPDDGQGMVLQPLDLVLGPDNFQIERMAGGRLVRIVPDPIIWLGAAGPDDVKSTNVAFFQGPDGRLQVGAVLY